MRSSSDPAQPSRSPAGVDQVDLWYNAVLALHGAEGFSNREERPAESHEQWGGMGAKHGPLSEVGASMLQYSRVPPDALLYDGYHLSR
ncbi:hypothetical protein PspLS_08868 [Pyricularia sp. CBS 133598]|nr:hypothetical protein PspLS_08868 [Pyricularia sp. CBS 133598]